MTHTTTFAYDSSDDDDNFDIDECPLADITTSATVPTSGCPFHCHATAANHLADASIPFDMRRGYCANKATTVQLLADIGGDDKIREFCTRFYARAFLDHQLKPFFFIDDGATAHGGRLAAWIIQTMGGKVYGHHFWQPAHQFARYSDRRAPDVRGNNFTVVDSRVWMRVHFWAARECGLSAHQGFWDWYIQFIEHFIRFYSYYAVGYARADADWSASPNNLATYKANDYQMPDLTDESEDIHGTATGLAERCEA
ncbi:Aste57867_3013 [Aphanomyces stellatus]|uniref:Aste57867_3013 protein n=1 Tax=Aphanomyces stellatus TaxID=120398 RepID=A0A485KE30_9STRA|nr:hypothetical protein As57867_003004 [Aphanomyces stellatus]VFT80193.1 Aste57867_3013 [Aphanomyces stellatus]